MQDRPGVAVLITALSLRTRLALLVSMVVAVVLGVQAYVETRIFERTVERDLHENARLTAVAVADEFELRSDPLATSDITASLHTFIEAAPGLRSISIVTMADNEPTVLASTSSDERREALVTGARVIRTGQPSWAPRSEGFATMAVPAMRKDRTFGAVVVTVSLAPVEQVQRRGRLVALWVVPSAILLLTLLIDALARRLIHEPLRTLRDTMGRAGAGDLSARAAVARGDEIGAVADGLNAMLDKIQGFEKELQDRIRDATSELRQKNEELAESYRRMLDLRSELARAEQLAAVGQMAANVAHQVGTPLNLIYGHVQIMEQEVASNQKTQRRLEIVREQIGKVDAVVRTLLDRARRSTAKKSVDVASLLNRVADLARPRLGELGVTLSVVVHGSLPVITADIEALELAILNLITNGLDAMPRGGRLTIEVTPSEAGIELVVSDTGEGIAPDLLPRIFEPWVTTKSAGHGTGLGLSIARDVIVRHGGTIGVASEPGAGTTFTIFLPAAEITQLAEPTCRES